MKFVLFNLEVDTMGSVWRLQTRTDSSSGEKISKYCLDNDVAALGWSIKDDHIKHYNPEAIIEIQEKRNQIENIDQYYDVIRTYGLYGMNQKKRLVAVDMLSEVEKGDYIWMRDNGIYYLGRVNEDSNFTYNCDKDALDFDAANQITGIKWERIGDESHSFTHGRDREKRNKAERGRRQQTVKETIQFVHTRKLLPVFLNSRKGSTFKDNNKERKDFYYGGSQLVFTADSTAFRR